MAHTDLTGRLHRISAPTLVIYGSEDIVTGKAESERAIAAAMADLGNDGGVMGPRGDRPKRRVFTAEFKAAILAEYEVAERAAGTDPARRGPVFLAHDLVAPRS